MTTIKDINWGSYNQYEGPFYRGVVPYLLPKDPSPEDKVMQVITATESGRYDAINMYDRCVLTAGIIQWCEGGQYSVSDLLGSVRLALGEMPAPLQAQCDQTNVTFTLNKKGRWRFFYHDTRGEVDTLGEQKSLFLLRSTGLKGTWDAESKAYAKGWAAAVANTLALPEAQEAQVNFTVPKLMSFVMAEAKAVLWGPDDPSNEHGGWVGATRAAYLSFAANLPSVANSQLKKALASTTALKWSDNWCIAILRQLTFGPQITIYPIRYNAIRPVLERLYGVDLPDFALELKAWKAKIGIAPTDGNLGNPPTFMSVTDIQIELIREGYDLGPAAADGRLGPKTLNAIMTFQGIHGLGVDGIVGPKTRKALVYEWSRRS